MFKNLLLNDIPVCNHPKVQAKSFFFQRKNICLWIHYLIKNFIRLQTPPYIDFDLARLKSEKKEENF